MTTSKGDLVTVAEHFDKRMEILTSIGLEGGPSTFVVFFFFMNREYTFYNNVILINEYVLKNIQENCWVPRVEFFNGSGPLQQDITLLPS